MLWICQTRVIIILLIYLIFIFEILNTSSPISEWWFNVRHLIVALVKLWVESLLQLVDPLLLIKVTLLKGLAHLNLLLKLAQQCPILRLQKEPMLLEGLPLLFQGCDRLELFSDHFLQGHYLVVFHVLQLVAHSVHLWLCDLPLIYQAMEFGLLHVKIHVKVFPRLDALW